MFNRIRPGKREKLFGDGRPRPLDRNAKARVMTRGRALLRPTQAGRAYGALTAKGYAVLGALLYQFHNAASGRCFPSLEAIGEAAGCAVSTVKRALADLERAGILSWVNRLARVRRPDGLGGLAIKVIRTSNAYAFNDPGSASPAGPASSKADLRPGTEGQEIFNTSRGAKSPPPPRPGDDPALAAALERLRGLAGFAKRAACGL